MDNYHNVGYCPCDVVPGFDLNRRQIVGRRGLKMDKVTAEQIKREAEQAGYSCRLARLIGCCWGVAISRDGIESPRLICHPQDWMQMQEEMNLI